LAISEDRLARFFNIQTFFSHRFISKSLSRPPEAGTVTTLVFLDAGPLEVISFGALSMSAFGGKADVLKGWVLCPLMTLSGHFRWGRQRVFPNKKSPL